MSRPTLDTLRHQLQLSHNLPLRGRQHLIAVLDAFSIEVKLSQGVRWFVMASVASLLGIGLWCGLVAGLLAVTVVTTLWVLCVAGLAAICGVIALGVMNQRFAKIDLTTPHGRWVVMAYNGVLLATGLLAAPLLPALIIATACGVLRKARQEAEAIVLGNRYVSLREVRADGRYKTTLVLYLMALEMGRRAVVLQSRPEPASIEEVQKQCAVEQWVARAFCAVAGSYDQAGFGQDPGEEWREIEREILGRQPEFQSPTIMIVN